MKALVKTFAAAALIAVSTFAMAAEGPGSKSAKANVNLSTADFALEHYVAVTTEGESAGESNCLQETSAKRFKLLMRKAIVVAR
ncbi:hypothetical protein KUH03_08800 [Sphingobacterium sp. E70]|uniref:hypothetical protein n=1 Tax=Sphingobacterium sp. E70 TaxID=2853439 RepID=UPI00211C4176|nr:hypothetical protein [Sphingobacterium sp. E70]ULT26905.1 hypothetical protein KUH03_08800 [Sphingobacterium sp. E70]